MTYGEGREGDDAGVRARRGGRWGDKVEQKGPASVCGLSFWRRLRRGAVAKAGQWMSGAVD